MEKKTARLTVLLDPARKHAFEELCRSQDITPSQVMRQLIRDFLSAHPAIKATSSAKRSPRAVASTKPLRASVKQA